MTDMELIKALRWCGDGLHGCCIGCPGENTCGAPDGGAKTVLDAADRLEALLAENERLKAGVQMAVELDPDAGSFSIGFQQPRPKWVSVSERLPEENDRYLCNVKSFAFPGCTYINILQCDKYGFREGNIYTDDVTHWMPLPEPPSTEGVE